MPAASSHGPTDEANASLAPLRTPLTHYLRALWGEPPPLHDIADALDSTRPFLSNLGLHLPRQQRGVRGALATQMYFAAAAHAAAHRIFPATPHAVGSLKPLQRLLVGVLEDARAEALALRELPGLMRLWGPLHTASPADGGEVRTLLARLSRALLDAAYEDPHPWIAKARAFQHHGALDTPAALREAASLLGNDIGQRRLQFDARNWVVTPAYRDDNAHLWLPDKAPEDSPTAELPEGARPASQALEHSHRIDARADAITALKERLTDTTDTNAQASDAHAIPPRRHREWDRLIGNYRQDWTTVIDTPVSARPPSAPPLPPEDMGATLQHLLRASQVHHPVRRRAQRDGDALDLDAVIERSLARRRGDTAERGVHLRVQRQRHDMAVLLLLDLSRSVSQPCPKHPQGPLPLIRRAAELMAHALEQAGDRCAIHGFRSAGRHEVQYLRFKDFADPMGPEVSARLASVDGALSTRLGAALRQATQFACADRADHRLVIVLTDGEPFDIDIHDPRYLLEDARQAVLEAASRRVAVGGVDVLGDQAEGRMTQVFGPRRHVAVRRLQDLARALQGLYERIAH